MSICPQRRISKTRKRLRRTHFKMETPGMMVCPNCGEMKLAHIVCSACGYYDGKLVKEIKVKEKKLTPEEKAKEAQKAEEAKRAEKKAEKEAKKAAKKSAVAEK
jgi:large subunit ribosomal protein L32